MSTVIRELLALNPPIRLLDLAALGPFDKRLALDAYYHALRTGDAKAGAQGWIVTARGPRRRICLGWTAYGLMLLRQGVLVKRRAGGIMRYLPPPPTPPRTPRTAETKDAPPSPKRRPKAKGGR